MLVKEAETIIHSLSEPSKMPGYGYGLPTRACKTGSKLRQIENSVCASCYACKGHYTFNPVINAAEQRLQAIKSPEWVSAMVTVLGAKRVRFFRWHDSGDLQSVTHLKKIIRVAEGVPDMKFWLPTKEKGILMKYFSKHDYVPENLCIRLSTTLIDSNVVSVECFRGHVQTSSVHSKAPHIGFECTAYKRGGKCDSCRVCWDKSVDNVSYKRH